MLTVKSVERIDKKPVATARSTNSASDPVSIPELTDWISDHGIEPDKIERIVPFTDGFSVTFSPEIEVLDLVDKLIFTESDQSRN